MKPKTTLLWLNQDREDGWETEQLEPATANGEVIENCFEVQRSGTINE